MNPRPAPPDFDDPREYESFKLGLWGGFLLGQLATTIIVLILDKIFGGC